MGFDKDNPGEGGIYDAFDDDEDNAIVEVDEDTPDTVENPFEDGEGSEAGNENQNDEPPELIDGNTQESEAAPEPDTSEESLNTEEGEKEIEPFSPSKEKAENVLGNGPRKLNKTFILCVIFGVLAFFVIFTMFIFPLFGGKKETKTKKPDTAKVSVIDYSALVPKKEREEPPVTDAGEYDDDLSDLPPVNPDYQYKPPEKDIPSQVMQQGTGGGTSERPNTRRDGLQSKTIRGIKGITPSQNQYLSGGGYPPQYGEQPPAQNNPYSQFGMPPKDEYMSRMLSQYGNSGNGGSSYQTGSTYANQNDQSGKMNFYNNGRENSGSGVWLSPTTVWQGTIFEAVLTSAINTDLPGEVTAVISKNVYSSQDGRYLLIPQNSKLYGSYNSSISYSQSRVQVGWHTLIRPDGYAINLGNMAATDSQGAAGLKGRINDHLFQYIKALGLMSVFNIVNSELDAQKVSSDNQYIQNLMANSQSVATTLGSKLIDRAMDVQPTITIKAGLKINIVANTTLALPPLEPYEVTQPYHR